MVMEICKRGQKLGKSRLSNTKLIKIGYPVDMFINLFQAVSQRVLRLVLLMFCIFVSVHSNQVQNGCFVQISLKKEKRL